MVSIKGKNKNDDSRTEVCSAKKIGEASRKKDPVPPLLHPSLCSLCLPPQEVDTLLKELFFFWVVTEWLPLYRHSIVPIVPLNNDARYSHQTPQALRFFFAAPEELDDDTATMPIYGPMAVLRSTGFHPSRDFKVRQFSNLLQIMKDLLQEHVKSRLSPHATHHTNDLDFNHLEVKVYQGKDIFKDPDTGEPLVNDWNEEIRDDCNKAVRLHNDLCFDDDGKQKETDTARGDHPIATLTIGSPRKLTFVHKSKSKIRGRGWKKVDDSKDDVFSLEQGSVFVLLPDDEIPEAIGDNLHKSQHHARFNGSGVSVALVFRSVRAKSLFHTKTHRWQWKRDQAYKKTVRKFLRGNSLQWKGGKKGRPSRIFSEGTVGKEIGQMEKNVAEALYKSFSPSAMPSEADREAFLEQLRGHIQDKLGQHYGIALDDSACPDDSKDEKKDLESHKKRKNNKDEKGDIESRKKRKKQKPKKKYREDDNDRLRKRWPRHSSSQRKHQCR